MNIKDSLKNAAKDVAATAITAAVAAVAWKGVCAAWCACSRLGSKAANKIVGSDKPNNN